MPRPVVLSAILLAAVTISAAAQGPSVDLGKRTAKSKYTLGNLAYLQELSDGRVIATDNKEGVFRLIDLAKGDVGIVGKQGDDEETYRRASTIIHLGDSLGLYDAAGRKLLHVSAQGNVGGFVPVPTLSSKRRLGQLLGADPSGALYFTSLEIMTMDTATRKVIGGTPGITTIVRVPAGSTTDETALTIRTRRADQIDQNGFTPFLFRDAVAIRNDGLIARVVSDTYQVIWMRDGKETGRTGPLANTPIAITAAEQQSIKDSTIAAFKAGMSAGANGRTIVSGDGAGRGAGNGTVVMAFGGGGGGGGGGAPVVITNGGAPIQIDRLGAEVSRASGQNGAPPPAGTTVDPAAMQRAMDAMLSRPFFFPETKPPMPSTGGAFTMAMFDANGMLWVPRERARGDAVPHYDVIAEGKGVVGRVNLPAGTRLIGFGKSGVYLARAEDGSDWLERYPMPKF